MDVDRPANDRAGDPISIEFPKMSAHSASSDSFERSVSRCSGGWRSLQGRGMARWAQDTGFAVQRRPEEEPGHGVHMAQCRGSRPARPFPGGMGRVDGGPGSPGDCPVRTAAGAITTGQVMNRGRRSFDDEDDGGER